jgi:transcriptional regulator with XRE-family HTH domain
MFEVHADSLHDACYSCGNFLHDSLSDEKPHPAYARGMDTSKEEVGKRLRAAREAADLTLQEAAARVPGLLWSRLGNWEQGTRTMPNEYAVKLSEVYGCSGAWLAGFTNDMGGNAMRARLVQIYDQLDDRGRAMVLRVAESEQKYIDRDETGRDKAA